MSKRLVDLTDDEIKEVVNYIFNTKEVKGILRNEEYDEIACIITTDWEDDESPDGIMLVEDSLLLQNPFEHLNPIDVDFTVSVEELRSFIQYCYAKGVVARNWVQNNPWLHLNDLKDKDKVTN